MRNLQIPGGSLLPRNKDKVGNAEQRNEVAHENDGQLNKQKALVCSIG